MIRLERADTLDTAMRIIDGAKEHLKEQGIDQWQNGYPDEACIRKDMEEGKGFFLKEGDCVLGYLCIDLDGEPAYDDMRGTWHTEEPYVVVHRLALTKEARGKGLSDTAFTLAAAYEKERGIRSFRVDTDADNEKMKHILDKNGFTYCGTIWFDHSEKIAYDKRI